MQQIAQSQQNGPNRKKKSVVKDKELEIPVRGEQREKNEKE